MTMATVGSRFQIVIPARERKLLEIKPQSKVEVVLRGDHLVVYPIPDSYRGIGKSLEEGDDAGDYIRRLRAEWGHRR